MEDYKEDWRTKRRDGGLQVGVEDNEEEWKTTRRSGGLLGGLEN